MVSQETMANTMERTSSRKKVRRQSSLWRRSNCARRSDTAVRPAAGDERWDASEAPFFIWLMEFLAAGKWPDGHALANIVRTVLTRQQYKQSAGVPYGYLYIAHKTKPASPRGLRDAGNAFSGGVAPQVEPNLAFGGGVGFRVLLQEVERRSFFGSKLGGFGNFLDRSGCGHFRQQLDAAVVLETRASGNEAAHDDVFLEAAEIVHLAGDRRFGEDAGGLLEAGGGDERVGRERRLGYAEEQRASRCGTATVSDYAVVLFAEAELVHLLLEEERGVADVFDLDPAHHLPRDRLDVLVVDVHALKAVNLLNCVHQVGLRELFAEDGQQVVQVERAVDQSLTGLDVVAFLHVDVHATRNRIFLGSLAVFAFDVDFAHALGDFAIAHRAIDFADDRGILGLAGLEELHNARETASDVFGLGGFARDFREHVAGLHLVAVPDHQVGAGRHEVLLANLARRIADKNGRLMLFVAGRQGNDIL